MKKTLLLSALVLAGCGPFQLDPVTPAKAPDSVLAERSISKVQVSLDQGMAADQRQVMENQRVHQEMERVLGNALTQAGSGDQTATVQVTVTSIRYSTFGPTRMHTKTEVTAPDGTVLKSFENESMSLQSKALERVAQDMVQKIADGV
jgi:hypothetical protein